MTNPLAIINPATESPVATVEMFTLEQTNEAIARSSQAALQWRGVAPADRARLLRRFSEVVDSHV